MVPPGREGTVGDYPQTSGVGGCGRQCGPTPSADPVQAKSGGVMVGTRSKVGQGGPKVGRLVVGHPLERLVFGILLTLTMVAEIKGEDIESEVTEIIGVRAIAPAITQVFMTENQNTQPRWRSCGEVGAGEFQAPLVGKMTDSPSLTTGANAKGKEEGRLREDPANDRRVTNRHVDQEHRQQAEPPRASEPAGSGETKWTRLDSVDAARVNSKVWFGQVFEDAGSRRSDLQASRQPAKRRRINAIFCPPKPKLLEKDHVDLLALATWGM